MELPFFPRTKRRDLPQLLSGDEGTYLAASPNEIERAAWYALALQASIEDAADLLEPRLPAEARPYVEVFERYLLERADHHMAQWECTHPAPAHQSNGSREQ